MHFNALINIGYGLINIVNPFITEIALTGKLLVTENLSGTETNKFSNLKDFLKKGRLFNAGKGKESAATFTSSSCRLKGFI